MVGAFLQPKGVLIDTKVLTTLSREQYRSGLGEVFKYAASLDADLFVFLEQNVERIRNRDRDVLGYVVAECCRIKAAIVEQDEFETTDLRILLNYGHTFAHAFEILSEYRMPHGLAVAVGSIHAARLARKLGLVDVECVDRHLALCRALDLPTEYPTPLSDDDRKELLRLMKTDKKTEFGRLRLVLPTGLGTCRVVEGVEADQTIFSH